MKEELFTYVVGFFASWAWQSLGKIPNPVNGKVEKNLEVAKQAIDILEMLKEKTKGNLNEKEERYLVATITELQLNYVDELNKEKKNEPEK